MLALAFLLFAAGILVPFFNVTQFWVFKDAVSVVSGLLELARASEWFLFLIIFVFTIVFPLVKLSTLAAVWWHRGRDDSRAARLLPWVAKLGKWSMLDVFVVAILVVTIKSAGLAQFTIGPGVYLFTASVVVTQFLSIRLEHRLRR